MRGVNIGGGASEREGRRGRMGEREGWSKQYCPLYLTEIWTKVFDGVLSLGAICLMDLV
jgi:hypothetical protein